MNIEIANRLQKLRKEKGYTQEELADALGISRQAVSKWERAEASPDTDNLILLAKLYGVSLDELLKTDEEDIETIKSHNQEETQEKSEEKKERKDYVHIGLSGIHVVTKEGEEVYVGKNGIHVNEKVADETQINMETNPERRKKYRLIESIVSPITALGVTIAYVLLGFLLHAWHPAWIIFFLIPIVSSIVEAIYKRKFSNFSYPVLVTAIYLILGLVYPCNWHPSWVIFLTIPIYYVIFNPIDKYIKSKHEDEVIVDIHCHDTKIHENVVDVEDHIDED